MSSGEGSDWCCVRGFESVSKHGAETLPSAQVDAFHRELPLSDSAGNEDDCV